MVQGKTAWQISKELFAERGFFGLYKGFRPTLLRDVIFSAVYFPGVAYFNQGVSIVRDVIFSAVYFPGVVYFNQVVNIVRDMMFSAVYLSAETYLPKESVLLKQGSTKIKWGQTFPRQTCNSFSNVVFFFFFFF